MPRSMTDAEAVDFLQWALPRLHLRWRGFRTVRRQVRKRLNRRLALLGLANIADYRRFLEEHPAEWAELDALCHITISRFGRDFDVWRHIAEEILPAAARAAAAEGHRPVRAWSAGCCGGEEPYTLAIAWELAVAPRQPGTELSILASDVDAAQLERAREACYEPGALRELPAAWRAAAFETRDGRCCLREPFRERVTFATHDLRSPPPNGVFDLILCRNAAFTYFDEAAQRAAAERLSVALAPGGFLVIGAHERLPEPPAWVEVARCIFTRRGDAAWVRAREHRPLRRNGA